MSFDYHTIAGDYQYRALNEGHAMQRFWHRGKLVMIDQLVHPHLKENSRLLEIGCGAGNLLVEASVQGSFSIALDLSMQALTFVRSRLQTVETGPGVIKGFACIQSIGEQLPFTDGSFDFILLSEVVEHLEEPQMSIREASRVLRPGGRLLVTTPNYRSFWPVMEWTVDRLNMAPKMGVEYFGTIYGVSPFLSLLSPRWAMKRLGAELKSRSGLGMILVAVGVKP